ncbi:single-stranded DNA-binding protein [Microbacterium sp. Sa4CUA7]|uniref:Single-stranded DNA-binding protein n=1 Tax=Microbacterium pullorum TaxID=2762236 RepID=A0ABR8RZC8_9MICO|nr:single-stranded DNA-binding protein [Microbacterium pullorum]MBD7956567.1 single-stranded DNA-binding protein [Microbacterium pullorum]
MSETITVAGNLAADPERRTTAGGDAVVSFRVGSTQRRLDKDTGQWVDAYTNWFHVSAFRSLAENALLSLRKGDRVIVTGTLRLRTWENDSRSGVTADIDAAAIGPDLRWGTTVFTRRARGEDRAEDRSQARSDSHATGGAVDAAGCSLPPSVDGDAPAAAQTPAQTGDGAPGGSPAEGEPEMAWAGGAGSEPPF